MTDETRLAKELVEREAWHVWLLSYGITHGRWMELSLNHGVPVGLGLICQWTRYFSGALEGGPYRLRLVEEDGADGSEITVASDDGKFVLKCGEIKIGRTFHQPDEPGAGA
jgi:hypothetical protein